MMLKLAQKSALARRAAARPFSSDVRPHRATLLRATATREEVEETEAEAEVQAAPLTALEEDLIAHVEAMGEEVLIESEMANAEDAEFLAAAQQGARLQAFRAHGGVYDSVLEELAAKEAGSAVAVDDVEDMEGPRSWKTAPVDPLADLTVEEATTAAAQVAALKLDSNELRTLIPADWNDSTVEWFSSKKTDDIALPEYRLNFLWTEKNIAVAVDQVYSRGNKSPLTEYFFWPRKDAWEEVKASLEARPWISERDKVILLNRLTEVINYWQEEEAKHSVEEARGAFPDCAFAGA